MASPVGAHLPLPLSPPSVPPAPLLLLWPLSPPLLPLLMPTVPVYEVV
jgi:hypothetical protein